MTDETNYPTTAASDGIPDRERIFYATGWYGDTAEGNRAVYTGELALDQETGESIMDAETIESLTMFQSITGNQIRRFRLVDEGPLF